MGSKTDQPTRSADAAALGRPSLSDLFWGDGERHHKFGSEPTTRGQLNQVADSAQITLTAMIAGPTNR